MKNNKRVLSLVLSTVMLLALLPAGLISTAATPYSINYDLNGVELDVEGNDAEAPDGHTVEVGNEFYLSNALAGTVYKKDGNDVVFYGWLVDGKLYQGGDFIEMPIGGITAVAVWARIAAVNPAYQGGDSDGSLENPYVDFYDAVVALKEIADTDLAAQAVAVYFVGNQTVDLGKYADSGEVADPLAKIAQSWNDSKGVFTFRSSTSYVMYDCMLRPIDLPFMLTSDSASTKVTFDNLSDGTAFFHFGFESYTFVENVNLYFQADNVMRYFFKKGGGIGMNATFTCNNKSLVQMAANVVEDPVRVYNSTFNFIYLGYDGNYTHHVYIAHNATIAALGLNNIPSKNKSYVDVFAGGTVRDLYYSFFGNKHDCSGVYDVTFHEDSSVGAIYDYNNKTWETAHCRDLYKSLTFHGYEGKVTYYHVDDVAHENPNGLNEINFLGGSSVQFVEGKGSTAGGLALEPNGKVFFDASSSLQDGSIGFVGVNVETVEETLTETKYALALPSFGSDLFYTFNGSAWNQGLTFTYNTGINGFSIDPVQTMTSTKVVLSNALRHVTKYDDNGVEVGFYAWNVGGETRYAGETLILSESSVVATAIWAPVVHVGATDDATEKYASFESIWEEYPEYPAGILCFEENYDWNISGFAHPGGRHEPMFPARSKPVFFVGQRNSVVLNLIDVDENDSATKGAFYYGFASFVGFDGITLTRRGRDNTAGRLTPLAGMYFGPDFDYVVTNNKQTLGFDAMSSTSSADYYIFGGQNWAFVYPNSGKGDQVHRVFIGGDNTVIGTIALNNINSYSNDYVQIDGGKIDILRFGVLEGFNSAAGKINEGGLTVTVSGGKIKYLYDHYGVDTNNGKKAQNYRTNKFCWNLDRTLIFDGFTGEIIYSHMTAFLPDAVGSSTPAEFYPNGLDNLIIKNGSNVTFKGDKVHLKAKDTATLYLSEDSTLTGTVAGVAATPTDETPNVDGNDSNATDLSVIPGEYVAWDGYNAVAYAPSTPIKDLGASIRIEAPYGIRFGFECSVSSFEKVTGLKVVRKGALIIPANILNDRELTRDITEALDVECNVPLAADKPNQYTLILIDSKEDSQNWLKNWKDVDFASCSYIELSDGSIIYSETMLRSVQGVADATNPPIDLDTLLPVA